MAQTRPMNAVTESEGDKCKVKLRFPPPASGWLPNQTDQGWPTTVSHVTSPIFFLPPIPKQLEELENSERNLSSKSSQLI